MLLLCACVCLYDVGVCMLGRRDHFSMVHRFMLIVCERISCGFSMHTQRVCCSNVNSFIGSFSLFLLSRDIFVSSSFVRLFVLFRYYSQKVTHKVK